MDKNTRKILNKLDRTIGKVINWEQMSNMNNLLYYKEKLKTETDVDKIHKFTLEFNKIKASIKKYKDSLNIVKTT